MTNTCMLLNINLKIIIKMKKLQRATNICRYSQCTKKKKNVKLKYEKMFGSEK